PFGSTGLGTFFCLPGNESVACAITFSSFGGFLASSAAPAVDTDHPIVARTLANDADSNERKVRLVMRVALQRIDRVCLDDLKGGQKDFCHLPAEPARKCLGSPEPLR